MASAIPTGPEQLLLELFAIFVSAKVVGEVFERISLPSVLGEILAGAVLGPYALNWIPTSDVIHSVADLGAIFVLFSAGLETSPGELVRIGGKSIGVALAGVIVPFVLGFAYMAMYFIASIALPYPVGLYNVPHCSSVPGINPPVSTLPVFASFVGA